MKKQPATLLTPSGEVNPLTPDMDVKFSLLGDTFPGLAAYSEARKAGRPKKADRKIEVKLRIAPDVLKAFKSMGKGWQTKMHNALKEAVQHNL